MGFSVILNMVMIEIYLVYFMIDNMMYYFLENCCVIEYYVNEVGVEVLMFIGFM